jgi:hypothetical protein
MNIIVIGSCQDSSTLAKELNRRLKNSIVARIDLLKTTKQLVLQGLNINTNENLGTYVGDVETHDFTKIPADKKQQIIAAVDVINNSIKPLQKVDYSHEFRASSTFDALTNGIPTSTYSFIKVYSGAINDDRVNSMLLDPTFVPNAVVITVKNPLNPLFPITLTEGSLKELKSKAFAAVECDNINELYKSEVFQLLFELTDEKELPVEETKGNSTPGLGHAVVAVLEEEFGLDMAA